MRTVYFYAGDEEGFRPHGEPLDHPEDHVSCMLTGAMGEMLKWNYCKGTNPNRAVIPKEVIHDMDEWIGSKCYDVEFTESEGANPIDVAKFYFDDVIAHVFACRLKPMTVGTIC